MYKDVPGFRPGPRMGRMAMTWRALFIRPWHPDLDVIQAAKLMVLQQDEADVKKETSERMQQDEANVKKEKSGRMQTLLDKARAQRDMQRQAAVVGRGQTAGQRKAK